MKSSYLFVLVTILIGIVFSACPNDVDEILPYPDCIQPTIDSILAMPVLAPPGKVEQWMDVGKTYYYVTGGCCDFFNYLYDADCIRVCAPDGGITGNGDGNCPAFGDNIMKTTVWEDTRK